MAGEIEEPFRMNFQADSIHSGSISFGRFETEALCWERRSSFSHNRYLEEVEKCSKPGSVIEKKAYFEAHFRKKRILGILGHSSPDSLNEKDYQTSDNGVSDNHSEIDHMSDENLSVRFEPSSETDASDRRSAEIDNLSAENHSARYSERPIGAAYGVELEVSQFESEVFGTSISEPQIEIACQNTEDVDPAAENFKVEESNNAVVGDLHPSDSTLGFGLEEKPDGEARGLNQIGLCIIDYDAAVNSCTSPEEQQGSSIKEKAPPVPKCTKTRLTPRLGVAKSRKNISSKELKGSKSKAEEKEKLSEVKPRTKTDMKCSEASTPNKYQICKTPKNEPASRTKGIDRIRSAGKESGRVAVSDPQFSTIKKAPIRMNQSAIRSKPTTGEPKPRMNQDGSKSGLRCNEPAQKRGQFSIRLEEKVHKNKTKTQQLHAKTQENKTEIKQLSKSLNLNKSRNFKAKPLPSFYHGALSESDRNKGTLNSVKPRKSQTDLLSAGTRVGTRMIPPTTPSSLQEPKEPCDIRLASGATSCHSTVTSDSNSSSPAAGNGNNHLSTCEINRLVGVKKDFKEKRMGLSKNKVAEANGRTIDVKQKTRTGRTTTYAACKK